jgi:hypothetical protein
MFNVTGFHIFVHLIPVHLWQGPILSNTVLGSLPVDYWVGSSVHVWERKRKRVEGHTVAGKQPAISKSRQPCFLSAFAFLFSLFPDS